MIQKNICDFWNDDPAIQKFLNNVCNKYGDPNSVFKVLLLLAMFLLKVNANTSCIISSWSSTLDIFPVDGLIFLN